MPIHLTLLIVYSVALAAGGVWVSRVVRSSGDFFVAGRRLSAPLLFATVLAANIGAGTTVGAAGLAYHEGVSAWWWNGSAALGSLGLAFWVGPRMWRLASERGFYTIGDYLEYRYNATVRGVMAALIWVGTLAILAAQLLAGAAVLNVAGGLSKPAGILVGGLLMTVYFTAGGLLSSVWVNVVQLVVLMAGFLIAMPLLTTSIGGLSALSSVSPPHEGYANFFYSSGAGMSGWAMVAVLTPAFIVSPGLVQKAYAAASERSIRLGIGAQALAQMVFAFVPVFFGIAARAAHLEVENPNLVLPTVLATSLSKDLYKRFLNPAADDRRLLTVARVAAIAGGTGGVLLAIELETVIGALTIFYSLLSVSLFVPLVAGLISSRGGALEALASMGAGTGTLLTVHFATGGLGYGYLSPNLLGLIAAALAFRGVMAVRRPGG